MNSFRLVREQFASKIKLILFPYLIISVCIIVGYTFLHWLVVIQLNLLAIRDDVVKLFIPMGVPWIPLIIWFRPRINLLKLKKSGNKDPMFGFIFCAGLVIVIAAAIAQEYIVTASGKLTNIDNIVQIEKYPKTKYYKVKHHFTEPRLVSAHSAFDVSGKQNEHFDMTIYVVVPILDRPLSPSSADTTRLDPPNVKEMPAPIAWMGLKFRKTISNKLAPNHKENEYKNFLKATEEDFRNMSLDKFIYLDRIGTSKDLQNYLEAVEAQKHFSVIDPIILLPVNEPYERRTGNKLAWVFGSLGIGTTLLLIALQFVPLRSNLQIKPNHPKDDVFGLKFLGDLLIPRKGFCITAIIIDINLIVFVLMALSGLGFITFKGADLLRWGANFRPNTVNGEYWRLFTNMFLHGGLMHVLFNLYGLLFAGIFLEPTLGKLKFATGYLITGLAASIASIWWYPATVSVGASGAIFGLYGIFLALLTTGFFPAEFKKAFLINVVIFVVINLLFGLTGGIDNAAHIGGLVSGITLGYIYFVTTRRTPGN